jgi:hypothetical protein
MASIDDLSAVDTRREHLLGILGHQLMGGTAVAAGWVQLSKNNVASSPDDENQYETDWVLTCDGHIVGYLDTEEKQGWSDIWPYSQVNVAKHPMSHWRNANFNGRLTNKLVSFYKAPEHSWWIGMRKDWQQAVLVNAADLFVHGRDATIRTRYSDIPLPVLQFPNSKAVLAANADHFTRAILNRFEVPNAVR